MRRAIFCCSLSLLFLVASGHAAESAVNTLTPEEVADGWILLFDGSTLFGWEAEEEKYAKDWIVEDGAITCKTSAGFNHIKNKPVFQDFHLKLEFWVNKKGNSGVFFRGAMGAPFVGGKGVNGYEAQVDDNDPRGLLYQTGGLYDVAPAKTLIKGEEEWRSYDIVAEGDHIVTKINGQTQVDAKLSKFAYGHIGLQHHNPGSVIKYRNIKLKPLGMKALFDGKSLDGWKVADRAKPEEKSLRQEWTVRDGALHVEVPKKQGIFKGGQGQLETTGHFKDFVLQMDVRSNGRWFNSGVFFRSLPGEVWVGYESQIRNQWIGEDRTKPVDFGTGGIYNLIKTRKVVSNDKEYFKKTIANYGRYIGVWVNGYQVADYTDKRPENPNARNGFNPNAGPIALQSHDPTTNLDFKDIEIEEIK